jgi:hypothetical protein
MKFEDAIKFAQDNNIDILLYGDEQILYESEGFIDEKIS